MLAKTHTRILILFIGVVLSYSASVAAEEQTHTTEKSHITEQNHTEIAIVDMNNLLERSVAVQSIKDQINTISENLSEELSSDEKKLKEEESRLLDQKGKTSQEEYDKLVNEFNKQVSEIQKKSQEKKTKIEKAHSEAMRKVNKTINEIITRYAEEKNYSVVLAKPNVLYHKNSREITEEVISLLNQRLQYVQVKFYK